MSGDLLYGILKTGKGRLALIKVTMVTTKKMVLVWIIVAL